MYLWFVVVALNLVACAEKQTPEEQVRAFLTTAVTAVEGREVLALHDLISDQYADAHGRDKRNLAGIATGYFLRHKNIHLFTQIDDIQFPADKQARVRLLVAMLGAPLAGTEALVDIRADLYQFELMLVFEQGDWLLTKADWKKKDVEALFAD